MRQAINRAQVSDTMLDQSSTRWHGDGLTCQSGFRSGQVIAATASEGERVAQNRYEIMLNQSVDSTMRVRSTVYFNSSRIFRRVAQDQGDQALKGSGVVRILVPELRGSADFIPSEATAATTI